MSFNVLNSDSEIFGKYVLEASAGSGKTFTIEHLFLKLLLDGKKNIHIEDILIVTFTNKATNELKHRIRFNLEKCLNILKDNNHEHAFTYLKDHLGNKASISKLLDALNLFERAQIFTIHAFCLKILNEFSLEAEILPSEINDDQNEKINLKIKNILKYNFNEIGISSAQLNILLKKYDIEFLVSKIKNSLSKKKNEKNKNFKEILTELNKKIKLFSNFDLEKEEILLKENLKDLKKLSKYSENDFTNEIKNFFKIIKKGFFTEEDLHLFIFNGVDFFEYIDLKNLKKSSKNFVISNVFKSLKENIYSLILESKNINSIFINITDFMVKRLNDFFDKNSYLTFDGILEKMLNATQKKNFRDKVLNKYKAAIVDEFQDTDEIQWKIFESIFYNNKNLDSLFLIGDPKQSIYRFRNADIYLYLNAKKMIGKTLFLDTNFRSSKSLIDSLNKIFSKDFGKNWIMLPKLNEENFYIPSKAASINDFDFNDGKSSIHFFLAEAEKKRTWPNDEIEDLLFNGISDEIIELKNRHGFTFNSFAILVKDRYQSLRLSNFLQRKNIKTVKAKYKNIN